MGAYNEQAVWEADVTILDTNEKVLGGIAGPSNRPLIRLANRTRWLKERIEASAVREPVGIIKMYAGTTPPANHLLCDGARVSRTTYADLFAVIGTRYGAGDGVDTFHLPDFREHFPLGQSLPTDAVGKGGAKQVTISQAKLPLHGHFVPALGVTVADNGLHGHGIQGWTQGTAGTGDHTHAIAEQHGGWTSSPGDHDHRASFEDIQSVLSRTSTAGGNLANAGPFREVAPTSTFNGAHTHAVAMPATNTLAGGWHGHSLDIPFHQADTTGSHSHSAVLPEHWTNNTGGGEPLTIMPPYQTCNFIITF